MRISALLCFVPLLCFGCLAQKFDPDASSSDFITVGDGGGFTGLETTYYVLPNGQLYKRLGLGGKIEQMKRIDRGITNQLFSSCRDFNLVDYQYEQPGNAYRFLSVHFGGKINRITWAKGDPDLQPQCKQIYSLLIQIIQEQL
ncbi:MAG: hypothetical protein OEQ53_15840 [Saprospiraceae bacterium]|nr:hypothetical protein [Saprospiraceae bacterium]